MEIQAIRKDSVKVGIFLGLIMPLIVIGVQYLIKMNNGWSLDAFIYQLKTSKTFLTGVSTFALVANGLLFGLLIQFRKYETGKGVFIPTVILSIGVLLYKLL